MATKDRSEIALLGIFLAVAVAFIALTTTFRSESATLFPRLTGAVVVVGVTLILLEDRLPEPLRRVVSEPVDLVDREEFESFEKSETDEEPAAEPTGAGTTAAEPAGAGTTAAEPTGAGTTAAEPTDAGATATEPTDAGTTDVEPADAESADAESTDASVADDARADEESTTSGTSDERTLTSRQFLFAAVAGYVALAYVFSILVATPAFVVAYGYWNRQRPLYVAGLVVASVAICLVFIWLANAPVDRGLLLPRGIF